MLTGPPVAKLCDNRGISTSHSALACSSSIFDRGVPGFFSSVKPQMPRAGPPILTGSRQGKPLGSTKRGTPARKCCDEMQRQPSNFFPRAPVSHDITASTPSSSHPMLRWHELSRSDVLARTAGFDPEQICVSSSWAFDEPLAECISPGLISPACISVSKNKIPPKVCPHGVPRRLPFCRLQVPQAV